MGIADDLGIFGARLFQANNVLVRNDEDVCRRLGIDVFEGEDAIILVNLFARRLATNDAAENALLRCLRHALVSSPALGDLKHAIVTSGDAGQPLVQ